MDMAQRIVQGKWVNGVVLMLIFAVLLNIDISKLGLGSSKTAECGTIFEKCQGFSPRFFVQ
jgi:hypothetical protein